LFGAAFEYYGDDDLFVATIENGDAVARVVGAGAGYEIDSWEFGIGYSFGQADIDNRGAPNDRFTLQRVALTADYELAAGIDVDGEIAYTWQHVRGPDFDSAGDHYDAVEFGLGTSIEF
jgi:hypothetical protein